MTQNEPLVRNISDTALWAAVYRARETQRPDALFRDPLAGKLAGQRGEEIAAAIPFSNKHTWSWVVRTFLFDQFIAHQIEQGIDLVLNLAAGLDARPYRMNVPTGVKWVEVDLPEMIAYKNETLAGERPKCSLERIALDLSQGDARRDLFNRLSQKSSNILVITEGLIIYFTTEQVMELARDLAANSPFNRWVTDLGSPGLVKMLQREMGSKLSEGNAKLQFGPPEGPAFFQPLGWQSLEIRSLLHTAAKFKRLPFMLRLISMTSKPEFGNPARPWSAVCLLGRT
jgi:methyltransferase (TIGR00027 family)